MSIGEYHSFKNDKTLQVPVTLHQAKLINQFICQKMSWPIFDINFTGRKIKRRMAQFRFTKQIIVVNLGGQRLKTILHELAHHCGPRNGHNYIFKETLKKVTSLFKENEIKILGAKLQPGYVFNHYNETIINKRKPVKKVILKPVQFEPVYGTFKQEKRDIFENIECEVINKNVHIKHIGRILSDFHLNNPANIRQCELFLKKKGITVLRG